MSADVHHATVASGSAAAVRDTVCGMLVDLTGIKPSVEHDGHRCHFCSERARQERRGARTLRQFDTLIVESTGTLTKGKPKLIAVLPEKGHEAEEVLHLAVSRTRGFEHPLAEAISHGIEERGVIMTSARDVEPITGKGVTGTVDGRAVALGNARLISEIGVDGGAHSETANDRRDQGETVLFVVADGAIAGFVNFADLVKETTPKALEALHGLGSRINMVTGDNERTAKAVAGKLGIDEIRAEVLPEDKARVIKELQDQSGRVAVAGASVAIQSAGFTLVKGNFDGFRFFDRGQWHCAQRVAT